MTNEKSKLFELKEYLEKIMSDNNVFMISDIDDSESDELSGEYKNDTIKVPDQALNSDAYLDFNSQNTNKCESIIHNALQNIIPKENDRIDNNESSNADDKDYFMVEKDDSDSENDQYSSKNSDQEIDTENDNEEEEKNEINDEDNNEEETKDEINNENSNEGEADNEINDNEEETKNEINNEVDNEEEDENETNDNDNKKEIEDEIIDKIDNDRQNINFVDEIDKNNDEENNVEGNSIVNDEKEVHYEYKDNDNEESKDVTVKSEGKSNEKNNNKKNKKNVNEVNNTKDRKNECNMGLINITDESNNFADESNDFADDSSHEVNKDGDNINDSSKNPIKEPPARDKSENPHRKLHRKKKSKAKKEKEDEIIKNENDESTNEKVTSHKKQSTKTKDKTKTDKNVKEDSTNHTIDEIAVISINNGDYSLINQSNIEKVMSKIRKMQRDALDEGDYELAKKAQLATQSAIRYYNEKQLLKHNSNRACEINVQLQATRNDIGFLKEHWARVLENAKQKANADLLQLRDEQDKKLKEFDDEYKAILSDPENLLPLEYKKSSSVVLLLRRKQSIFINANNFKMAKEIKKELKELEEKERNENFLKFQKKKTAERNLLIKKQDEMFAVRKENWYRTIEGIKSVANYEIEHARKSEKQLESKFMQTNEFSNKLIRQQQQRTSSLQTKKKEQGQQTQQLQGSDGKNVKTVTHTQFTIQRNADKTMAQEFRQRAMINRIIYTNRITPKVRKPVPNPKPKRQYPRTPR